MLEITLLLGVLAIITLLGFLATIVTPDVLYTVGVLLLVVGLTEGLPTGLWYHVVLHRSMANKGALPSRWWIHPSRFHASLTPDQHRRVKFWFMLGGLGYILAVAGGLAAIVGILIERL